MWSGCWLSRVGWPLHLAGAGWGAKGTPPYEVEALRTQAPSVTSQNIGKLDWISPVIRVR